MKTEQREVSITRDELRTAVVDIRASWTWRVGWTRGDWALVISMSGVVGFGVTWIVDWFFPDSVTAFFAIGIPASLAIGFAFGWAHHKRTWPRRRRELLKQWGVDENHTQGESSVKMQIDWLDSGREPKCAPNPDYPKGQDIKAPAGMKHCQVDLPYPAKRCGMYVVRCPRCEASIAVSTAGRPDDPRSVEVPCRAQGGAA